MGEPDSFVLKLKFISFAKYMNGRLKTATSILFRAFSPTFLCLIKINQKNDYLSYIDEDYQNCG